MLWGPIGRAPTEGRRTTSAQHGVQADNGSANPAGRKTVAELSRELDISPSVIRNWKRFAEAGATTAV
jgi:transposase-like protein